ncbi:MAG: tRNA threonylcarbamoyladenosine dehydratase [Bacteroidetes bacterium]|uniref:tRNA threonylcarbamoyladenosine dehydratase n=1 Tax=Candidatus Cryptobacteroides excrementavium TaxID=2840759 RepID=A0A9D9J3F8_9BACT|nr:tRNA threonylcarbamoyladenosine dehydratase [Candidatus Cryptobacteroides excrementavium]
MGEDWKERTRMLAGESGLRLLENACVAVIGVGGVGGYAAEMIARAGVGHMIILDSDTVSVTNKNRQILALDSTVGRPKCRVLAERLADINPDLDLTVLETYLDAGDLEAVLGGYHIDYLVDAIDTLSPKMALIKYCMDNGIPHVSSMGAGAKTDATRVRLADISKSYNCPLAFVVRKRLRRMGIRKGFKVVFSEELPVKSAIVECDERNKKSQVGTVSYMPAVFGCICAQAAILHILGQEESFID